MSFNQLQKPRLGLFYRHVTALNQPFQPVYLGKNGIIFGLSLVKFRLAPSLLVFLVNRHREPSREMP